MSDEPNSRATRIIPEIQEEAAEDELRADIHDAANMAAPLFPVTAPADAAVAALDVYIATATPPASISDEPVPPPDEPQPTYEDRPSERVHDLRLLCPFCSVVHRGVAQPDCRMCGGLGVCSREQVDDLIALYTTHDQQRRAAIAQYPTVDRQVATEMASPMYLPLTVGVGPLTSHREAYRQACRASTRSPRIICECRNSAYRFYARYDGGKLCRIHAQHKSVRYLDTERVVMHTAEFVDQRTAYSILISNGVVEDDLWQAILVDHAR